MKLTPQDGQLSIAVLRIGGIGDAVQLAAQARAIKRKYPNAFITLLLRDMDCREIVNGHPSVDRIVVLGRVKWSDGLDVIKDKPYDIIYDNRYVTRVLYNLSENDERGFNERLTADKKVTDEAFAPYLNLYDGFPLTNTKLAGCGRHSIDLMFETACLKGSEEDLLVAFNVCDGNMAKLLEGERYVTIHNGADIARQTKCWPTRYWNETVKILTAVDYKVVQLGRKAEEPVKGCIDMRGRTSLKETTALINGAKFHIDTEGGLVHIARAIRTRCVVMFGPTPVTFFGYDCNVNVETPEECKGCWWENDMWWRECPKKYPAPVKCMENLTPSMVGEAVSKVILLPPMKGKLNPNDVNEQFAMELTLNESHYKAEKHQWDRVWTMMAKVRGKDVLEVGAGDGYCSEVLKKQGFNVTSTEISQIRLERIRNNGLDGVYADVDSLPFPDNSFDAVMCGEVLEHIDSMGQGLKELERVCRPDGIIIISLPVGDDYRKIEMHKWGIGHHMILRDGKEDLIVLTFERINS